MKKSQPFFYHNFEDIMQKYYDNLEFIRYKIKNDYDSLEQRNKISYDFIESYKKNLFFNDFLSNEKFYIVLFWTQNAVLRDLCYFLVDYQRHRVYTLGIDHYHWTGAWTWNKFVGDLNLFYKEGYYNYKNQYLTGDLYKTTDEIYDITQFFRDNYDCTFIQSPSATGNNDFAFTAEELEYYIKENVYKVENKHEFPKVGESVNINMDSVQSGNVGVTAEEAQSGNDSWSEQNWPENAGISTAYFANVGWLVPATFEFWAITDKLYPPWAAGNIDDSRLTATQRQFYSCRNSPVFLLNPKKAFGRETAGLTEKMYNDLRFNYTLHRQLLLQVKPYAVKQKEMLIGAFVFSDYAIIYKQNTGGFTASEIKLDLYVLSERIKMFKTNLVYDAIKKAGGL